MRTLACLSMAMLFSGALFGQHSGGRSAGGGSRGGGGFHSGGGFHLGGGSGLVGSGRRAVVVPYAYPVYVGGGYGYYYPPDYTSGYVDETYAPVQVPQQPNVTVVYPPPPAPAMGSQFEPGANPEPVSPYQPSSAQADDQAAPDHYLLALKDHTIYSVVAYWVDGDTLHYFTAGNVHNQVSLPLVDRDLTARLNKESGMEVKLPPAK